jgi:hypothetical protein
MRAIACLVLLLAAAPAAASIAPKREYPEVPKRNPLAGTSRLPGPGIHRDLDDIRDRIEDRRERGEISRREARQLKREARIIEHSAYRYGRDGLSESERSELEARALYLRGAVGASTGRSGK